MKIPWKKLAELTAVFLLVGTRTLALADLITFQVTWEPSPFVPSTASAVGLVTIDTAILPNPGAYSGAPTPMVRSLTITVTGANSGNGTFDLSDYHTFYWSTGFPCGVLDLTKELVGQPLPDGTGFLTDRAGVYGEFNFLARCTLIEPQPVGCPALLPPSGVNTFTMRTMGAGEEGNEIILTSIRPIAIVPQNPEIPEPATTTLIGLALIVLAGFRLSQPRYRSLENQPRRK